MTLVLAALSLSFTVAVAPGLRIEYCQAVQAWTPYRAEVRQVKWCDPGECAGMGGGMYDEGSRVIAIDPQWPFRGSGLLLTLEHEYGHALGLDHRWDNSIMKPGWDPPFAPGPTEVDFRDLRRIYRDKSPGNGAEPDIGGCSPCPPAAGSETRSAQVDFMYSRGISVFRTSNEASRARLPAGTKQHALQCCSIRLPLFVAGVGLSTESRPVRLSLPETILRSSRGKDAICYAGVSALSTEKGDRTP